MKTEEELQQVAKIGYIKRLTDFKRVSEKLMSFDCDMSDVTFVRESQQRIYHEPIFTKEERRTLHFMRLKALEAIEKFS
jgi:hypothetical protein